MVESDVRPTFYLPEVPVDWFDSKWFREWLELARRRDYPCFG